MKPGKFDQARDRSNRLRRIRGYLSPESAAPALKYKKQTHNPEQAIAFPILSSSYN